MRRCDMYEDIYEQDHSSDELEQLEQLLELLKQY